MPYTPTTPTLTLCDQLVAALNTAWAPKSPSKVERAYFKRLADEESQSGLADALKLQPGERRVIVMPGDYDSRYENHAEDTYTHEIGVVTVERYTDAGDPPKEWLDERVDFVYEEIVRGLDFSSPPTWNTKLRTIGVDVSILDLDRLLTGGLLFYSRVDFVFEEIRTA